MEKLHCVSPRGLPSPSDRERKRAARIVSIVSLEATLNGKRLFCILRVLQAGQAHVHCQLQGRILLVEDNHPKQRGACSKLKQTAR